MEEFMMIIEFAFWVVGLTFCLIPLIAYVFHKTGRMSRALMVGVAYPLGAVSPFIIYNLFASQFVSGEAGKVLFSLTVALVFYWLLKKVFHLFWVVRAEYNRYKKGSVRGMMSLRPIRKIIRTRSFSCGLWRIARPRKH